MREGEPPVLVEPLQPEWASYLAPLLVTELELECGLELTGAATEH